MSQEKENKEKKERVKYKFGQKELDLDNYIYNLGTNVQSYLNNKNWSDSQKQDFMNAYEQYLTGLKDQSAQTISEQFLILQGLYLTKHPITTIMIQEKN